MKKSHHFHKDESSSSSSSSKCKKESSSSSSSSSKRRVKKKGVKIIKKRCHIHKDESSSSSSSSSSSKCKKESSSSSSKCKKECRKCKGVLGFASFSAPTFGGTTFNPGELIPLNNEVIAECIDISPLGGLVIKKSGTYGITFNVNLAGSGQTTPAVFEIYANARLIASVTVYPFATLAKVAKIVCLEKNEVLQVKAATTITLYDANLTAARLDSHKHESSSSSSFKCKHESSSSSSTCKKECRKCHEVLGYASFSANNGRLFDPDEFIPLNNEVIAECTDISPIGGLAIKKSGTYGITFNANLQSGTNATFEIFANARLIASVTVLPNTTLAKVGKIVCLEENEVLQVKNATATQINLFDANLTAAKLDD